MARWLVALLVVGLAACDDGGSTTPPDAARGLDAGVQPDAAPPPDARVDAAGPARDAEPDAAEDAGRPPLLDASPPLPPPVAAGDQRAPRTWRFARGLIHMHSVHSHDACDGDPKPDGQPNAPCLARFRAAICQDRFDFLLLTDHPASFDDVPMEEALLHADGDTWVEGPDGPIANRVACPDGRSVLLAAGSEGDLMPVLFERKPPAGNIRDASPEGVARLREFGALVFQAHTERFAAEELAPLGLDGIEIYNLHANLDPRGELQQLPEILPDLVEWIGAGQQYGGPHPDYSFLAAFRENPRALAAWDGLTQQTRILGFAGSDIHENLPPLVRPSDGDRIDSYRRLGSWFSNYILVEAGETLEPATVKAALRAGRLFVAFDVWGPPTGFDFHATHPDGRLLEMGAEEAFVRGIRLEVRPPVVPPGATVDVLLRRVTAEGAFTVEQASGPISFEAAAPGVYRVEVRITPGHLRDALGPWADRFLREVTWIYANPIYLR
ncbi:MAG: hypothetical protein H6706_20595 [Myxococcales bacterium]|nr:hypothetical protein [Myxococcales bacterium]